MNDKSVTPKKAPRRKPTPKERLKALLNEEQKLITTIEKSGARLKEVRKEIKTAQTEAVGLEFFSINPDEFVKISDSLEQIKIPPGEILKLLSKGNIEKLQEIYYAMKSAGVVSDDDRKDA